MLDTARLGGYAGRVKAEQARAMVEGIAKELASVDRKANILDGIAWPRVVEERFFADGASKMPTVEYAIDRARLDEQIAALRKIEESVEGEGAIPDWLRSTARSYIDGARLLGATGTRAFGNISREIYGGAKTSFFDLGITNYDLAEHLGQRLEVHGWDETEDGEDPSLDAQGMVAFLEERIAKRKVPVRVILDPSSTSKAIAGSSRVRVRPDATFTSWEAEGLYRHEIETHAFTALNGALQEHVPFLKSGGPRATATQEGLAVFAELYHRALATPRLRRLVTRVEMVAMAEDGASFIDVFRFLVNDRGIAERDAFLDAQRVFRGGLPEGGAVFTKDACYLAGLVEVHAFLAAFVRAGFRDECEMLVCGRFALQDVAALIELRALGILSRPKYRPRWLREWGTLLPFFAFSSFLESLQLAPVEARYAEAIRIASAATPRRRR